MSVPCRRAGGITSREMLKENLAFAVTSKTTTANEAAMVIREITAQTGPETEPETEPAAEPDTVVEPDTMSMRVADRDEVLETVMGGEIGEEVLESATVLEVVTVAVVEPDEVLGTTAGDETAEEVLGATAEAAKPEKMLEVPTQGARSAVAEPAAEEESPFMSAEDFTLIEADMLAEKTREKNPPFTERESSASRMEERGGFIAMSRTSQAETFSGGHAWPALASDPETVTGGHAWLAISSGSDTGGSSSGSDNGGTSGSDSSDSSDSSGSSGSSSDGGNGNFNFKFNSKSNTSSSNNKRGFGIKRAFRAFNSWRDKHRAGFEELVDGPWV